MLDDRDRIFTNLYCLRAFFARHSNAGRGTAEKKARRPAAMITFRSPSAHVSYWRKSGNTCRKSGVDCYTA